ncbi:MAG: nuclear transport factor 2 family protein [Minisyncoccia bacterium]
MTPKETVTKYWEAYTKHDQEGVLSVLAPDYVLRSPMSQGRATSKDMVAGGLKLFEKSFPNLKEEVVSMTAEGDRVVCEVLETATFTGSLDWPTGAIAPTNKSYKLPFAAFFRVNAEGLIAEQQNYWDTAAWIRQVGIDAKLFEPKG